MHKSQLIDYNDIYVEVPQPLTLATRRLFNYLLHFALTKNTNNYKFETSFETLAGVFSVDPPQVDQLSQAVKLLMRTLINVQFHDKVLTFPMLAGATINGTSKKLSYTFSENSKEIFHSPILLEHCLIQAHFTYKYTNLLYKLLAPKYFLTNTDHFKISIEKLRDYLNIQQNKLINFADFSRFVLTPAIMELNAYSSFALEIETQSSGRKITEITFKFIARRHVKELAKPISVIPPMRPRFNLTVDQQKLYSDILNAPIKKRQAYFKKACKAAEKHNTTLDIALLDLPDVWMKWL